MRSSVWNLRPLAREAETRTFRDPEQPEWHLTLTLRPMDGVSGTRYATLKAKLMVEHVTGLVGPDGLFIKGPDGEPVQKPEPVRCGDFSKRTPDEFCVDRYAKLAAMWADPEEEAPPLSEVVGWQVLLYEGWFDICNWIEELYRREPAAGFQKGGSTETSSAPSSSDMPSIPNSPPAGTPCSVASNGASGPLPVASEPLTATSPAVAYWRD